MDLVSALVLLVSITLPNGKHVPSKPIRLLGGVEHVAHVEQLSSRAAREQGVSLFDLLALLVDESGLRTHVLSFNRSSRTISQLNTRGKYYRAYRNACSAVPSECLYAAIRVGAYALAEAQAECGTGPAGFGRYRSRRCLLRERERITHRKARRLARTTPRSSAPTPRPQWLVSTTTRWQSPADRT